MTSKLRLYSLAEAAELLKISKSALISLAMNGEVFLSAHCEYLDEFRPIETDCLRAALALKKKHFQATFKYSKADRKQLGKIRGGIDRQYLKPKQLWLDKSELDKLRNDPSLADLQIPKKSKIQNRPKKSRIDNPSHWEKKAELVYVAAVAILKEDRSRFLKKNESLHISKLAEEIDDQRISLGFDKYKRGLGPRNIELIISRLVTEGRLK